jgi:hypothetical protein
MEQNDYKFTCKACNYNSNYESKYKQHLETLKHKNNGILVRKKPELKKCDKCNFTSTHNEGFKTHYLTKHSSKEEKEKEFTYYCKLCDFGTFSKSLIEIHNNSKKHKNLIILFSDKSAF